MWTKRNMSRSGRSSKVMKATITATRSIPVVRFDETVEVVGPEAVRRALLPNQWPLVLGACRC